MLDVAWSSLNSKNFRPLGEKAKGLFTNKLCTLKEVIYQFLRTSFFIAQWSVLF